MMLLLPAQDLHTAGALSLDLDLTCQASHSGILSYPPTEGTRNWPAPPVPVSPSLSRDAPAFRS